MISLDELIEIEDGNVVRDDSKFRKDCIFYGLNDFF